MSEFDPRDWPAQEPPADFAERVVAAARVEGRKAAKPQRGRVLAGMMLVGSMAAGIALAVHLQTRGNAGDVTADARREVRVGTRAIAVLEAGAHVKWHGDDIEQADGDVFWRVEPGARFTVHTAAADVTVKGTCFRVRVKDGEGDMTRRDAMVGAVGAVVGAAAFVGVYEGKVAVSHAGQSVDVAAGQGAQADGRGVHLTGLSPSAASSEADPLLAANANLADAVRDYRRRLEAIDADKKKLQQKLAEAEAKLGDAGVEPKAFEVSANKFDLSQDDWKELAKQGKLPTHLPCPGSNDDFSYAPDTLNALGLAPQDGPIVQAAMKRSGDRTWAVIKPLCAKVLPGADPAELGPQSCMSILQAFAPHNGPTSLAEQVRQAAEIEAGMRPMPGPNDDLPPMERALVAMASDTKKLEADLAQQLGPDAAKAVVYGSEGCWSDNVWQVGPREQK